jgi:AraC-like DNA-binding protein
MKLYFKYDAYQACAVILQEKLDSAGIAYEMVSLGEVAIKSPLTEEQSSLLTESLKKYGIEIITNQKSKLIQKIKDLVIEMIYSDDKLPVVKFSVYLSEKLNHSPGYLSNLFSEVTYSSIENFIITQKIERVKQLIIANELTLTEISHKLNYSSVAHLSNQFKQNTGLTPTAFQRIIQKRSGAGIITT